MLVTLPFNPKLLIPICDRLIKLRPKHMALIGEYESIWHDMNKFLRVPHTDIMEFLKVEKEYTNEIIEGEWFHISLNEKLVEDMK